MVFYLSHNACWCSYTGSWLPATLSRRWWCSQVAHKSGRMSQFIDACVLGCVCVYEHVPVGFQWCACVCVDVLHCMYVSMFWLFVWASVFLTGVAYKWFCVWLWVCVFGCVFSVFLCVYVQVCFHVFGCFPVSERVFLCLCIHVCVYVCGRRSGCVLRV